MLTTTQLSIEVPTHRCMLTSQGGGEASLMPSASCSAALSTPAITSGQQDMLTSGQRIGTLGSSTLQPTSGCTMISACNRLQRRAPPSSTACAAQRGAQRTRSPACAAQHAYSMPSPAHPPAAQREAQQHSVRSTACAAQHAQPSAPGRACVICASNSLPS